MAAVKLLLDIYQRVNGEYSWRLNVGANEVAQMPDGTGSPWKVKRTVRALQKHCGKDSPLWHACEAALVAFERLHPTPGALS